MRGIFAASLLPAAAAAMLLLAPVLVALPSGAC
jgi:hypothetical protein